MSLKVSEVHKDFTTPYHQVEVLRGVTFDLEVGESLAITGPSGSGKSTLLHLIGTLDRPSSGEITIAGADPFALADAELARFRNSTIGFVFQDHHLLPQYSVLENVLLPTLAFKSDPGERRSSTERARELLDRVGLGERLEHRPAELSGGERQRVAVARALVNQPGLLLCDEPTGSLDHATATTVSELLMELHGSEPTILIVVTHSLELARKAGRRYELREGACVEL
ncbi:MAG: ABC transporter ATP-binding protein [bacterium]|nr:ABC transporter ATP-binding protein [bacterium]